MADRTPPAQREESGAPEGDPGAVGEQATAGAAGGGREGEAAPPPPDTRHQQPAPPLPPAQQGQQPLQGQETATHPLAASTPQQPPKEMETTFMEEPKTVVPVANGRSTFHIRVCVWLKSPYVYLVVPTSPTLLGHIMTRILVDQWSFEVYF